MLPNIRKEKRAPAHGQNYDVHMKVDPFVFFCSMVDESHPSFFSLYELGFVRNRFTSSTKLKKKKRIFNCLGGFVDKSRFSRFVRFFLYPSYP